MTDCIELGGPDPISGRQLELATKMLMRQKLRAFDHWFMRQQGFLGLPVTGEAIRENSPELAQTRAVFVKLGSEQHFILLLLVTPCATGTVRLDTYLCSPAFTCVCLSCTNLQHTGIAKIAQ